jgi:hypothetical protein
MICACCILKGSRYIQLTLLIASVKVGSGCGKGAAHTNNGWNQYVGKGSCTYLHQHMSQPADAGQTPHMWHTTSMQALQGISTHYELGGAQLQNLTKITCVACCAVLMGSYGCGRAAGGPSMQGMCCCKRHETCRVWAAERTCSYQ